MVKKTVSSLYAHLDARAIATAAIFMLPADCRKDGLYIDTVYKLCRAFERPDLYQPALADVAKRRLLDRD